MAHYQSRPLPFKLQPVCLSTALISGRDIEVMSRHLLFSVPSMLMSRPQYVATDFFLFDYFPGRDIKVMSRHHFFLLSSSLCCDLNEWSRHHFYCQDFSS